MEMLVVISIIGLLGGIILTSFIGVKKLARDSKRVADLRQLNSAIQFYINDNGHAPYLGSYNCQASNSDDGSCRSVSMVQTDMWDNLKTELTPYLNKLPSDPCGVSCNVNNRWATYFYKPPASIKNYCISSGCTLTDAELNNNYSIHAGVMEVADTDYTSLYKGTPTFGYKTFNFGTSF